MNKVPSFLLALLLTVTGVQSFSSPLHLAAKASSLPRRNRASFAQGPKSKLSRLYMNMNGDEVNNSGNVALSLSESDQTVVAVTGLITSPVMLYSEYVLKMTGCGLPAGPFGLYGAIEGLSYLGITGLVAFSLYTKVKTVRSLHQFINTFGTNLCNCFNSDLLFLALS